MNIYKFRRVCVVLANKFMSRSVSVSQNESRLATTGVYLQSRRRLRPETRVCQTRNRCSLFTNQIRSLSSASDEKNFKESEETFQQPKSQTTIDEEEVKKFNRLSFSWWDENGELALLHFMNELRVPLIRDSLVSLKKLDQYHAGKPLEGFRILDIGSGGGILSEALARLGASVVGLDASEESIKIAQTHLIHDPAIRDKVQYIKLTVEEFAESQAGTFDAVVASEVVEHVSNASMFVSCACKLIKPGGSIFFTTLNKTRLSYILAIVMAENIFKIVPPGTHDWHKFVPPRDLQYMLEKNNFTTRLVHGMCYNMLTKRWSWVKDTSVNYALHAVAPPAADKSEQKV